MLHRAPSTSSPRRKTSTSPTSSYRPPSPRHRRASATAGASTPSTAPQPSVPCPSSPCSSRTGARLTRLTTRGIRLCTTLLPRVTVRLFCPVMVCRPHGGFSLERGSRLFHQEQRRSLGHRSRARQRCTHHPSAGILSGSLLSFQYLYLADADRLARSGATSSKAQR
jgi:hypothetical protein